jgi:hypothetical protein
MALARSRGTIESHYHGSAVAAAARYGKTGLENLHERRRYGIYRTKGWRYQFGERVFLKPRLKPSIALAIFGLSLTGAILGSGLGRPETRKVAELPSPTVKLSLPPSTVIHPPMICRQGGCSELKQGAP